MDEAEIYQVLNRAYFSADCHEKKVVENLPDLLAGARVFVDVGASLGQYVFHANKVLHDAEIFAVEADPIRFAELRRNCEKWQSEGDNVITAVHAAASDRPGTIVFQSTESDVSGGLFRHPAKSDVEWTEISVPSVTLDDLVGDRLSDGAPAVVKVDVEGAELRVLEGGRRLLAGGAAKWLVEVHGWPDPESGGGTSEIYAQMASFGYHHVVFHGQDLFVRDRPSLAALAHGRLLRAARRLARALRGLARNRGGRATGS